MSERMTPERRAELREHLNEYGGGLCSAEGRELLAEIDALTAELAAKDKALDQAIDVGRIFPNRRQVGSFAGGRSLDCPELAAELRKREGQ